MSHLKSVFRYIIQYTIIISICLHVLWIDNCYFVIEKHILDGGIHDLRYTIYIFTQIYFCTPEIFETNATFKTGFWIQNHLWFVFSCYELTKFIMQLIKMVWNVRIKAFWYKSYIFDSDLVWRMPYKVFWVKDSCCLCV